MKINPLFLAICVALVIIVLLAIMQKEHFVGPVFWSCYPQMNTKPNCNLSPYYSQLYGSGLGVSCC